MTSYIAHVSECVQVKLREPVLQLALDMEEKLARNDHKGGWNGMSLLELFDRMLQEERELMAAIEGGFAPNIIDECVDVANFAMMIADMARRMQAHERTVGDGGLGRGASAPVLAGNEGDGAELLPGQGGA